MVSASSAVRSTCQPYATVVSAAATAKPSDGDQAGRVAALRARLGDHRVDQHHEQRARGEAVDRRPGTRLRRRRRSRSRRRSRARRRRRPRPTAQDRRRARRRAWRSRSRSPRAGWRRRSPTSSPTLTPSPVARPIPSTSLLGDAVEERAERERRAGVDAAPARRGRAVGEVVRERAGGEADATAAPPPTFAPSSARSKLTALISAPAPNARTRPTSRVRPRRASPSSAPRTSEEAASAPQPSAADIATAR